MNGTRSLSRFQLGAPQEAVGRSRVAAPTRVYFLELDGDHLKEGEGCEEEEEEGLCTLEVSFRWHQKVEGNARLVVTKMEGASLTTFFFFAVEKVLYGKCPC